MAGATKKREARKIVAPVRHGSRWTVASRLGLCVVQDISTAGARITMDDQGVSSDRLRLAFARDARTGRNCEVVWRRGKSLGVKFVR